MKIKVLQNDITEIKVDAIVNAANSSLLGGGGVDGAIHRKGGKKILEECIEIRNRQGECKTGEAVITSGGNLPCKYVIHTVGPIWKNGNSNEDILLSNCYLNSLKLASSHQVKTIAFPNISTGVYRFPKNEAAKIAVETTLKFIQEISETSIEEIQFICFDNDNFKIYKNILNNEIQ